MTTHTLHESSLKIGLVDGCERCEQHASHPFSSLDEDHLKDLILRVDNDDQPRSDNEGHAMSEIRLAIERGARVQTLRDVMILGDDSRKVLG